MLTPRLLLLLIALTASTGGAVAAERTGGWRLADAASPYLRMHQDNPVNWYPWGPAALERAQRTNRPLFISIGYFTCHWCHVMERESFLDPAIAELLNRHFVAVKIDREQRPDLDEAYRRFVEETAGHAGWPLNVWATPEAKPFLGGVYFPPEASQGQPGMKGLLRGVAERWANDAAFLRQRGEEGAALIQQGMQVTPRGLPRALAERAATALGREFDPLQGGFGTAPKFPRPADLLFLLSGDDNRAAMARATLRALARGSIRDQLGGGFHRYAVDPAWRVPHFEKMLYTQALLARAFLAAHRRYGTPRWAALARETLAFTRRELALPGGGFRAALAADSPRPGAPGQSAEGAYYTWTWDQFTRALGTGERRAVAAARFGVSRDGNARGEGGLGRANVLYQARSPEEVAAALELSPARVTRRLREADRALQQARTQRPPPPADDKLVATWNGLMITALAEAGTTLGERAYLRRARQAANAVWRRVVAPGPPVRVRRSDLPNRQGPAGTAADYLALAEGALAIHAATGEGRWLGRGRALADAALARFWDPAGGFFSGDTPVAGGWLRIKPFTDNPVPSANAIGARVLARLGRVTGNARYTSRAREAAAWMAARIADSPQLGTYLLAHWERLRATAPQ
ncbi:MAG TPA: thioredoxin domain-containing protein [Gammaproteobacteria bacterium]|nr:thioredoxin domain-containing protein [Gammaproteobacteria bacterium]